MTALTHSSTATLDRASTEITPLTIRLTTGVGTGPTTLAAFDGALRDAGIANFNLLCLSSVIPTGATLEAPVKPAQVPAGGWGDRLYIVMAEMRITTDELEAWAGIGWVQDDETGRGLFVEHEGHSRTEVEDDILASLGALAAGRPQSFGEPQMLVAGTPYLGVPTCAMVAAVYESHPWRGEPVLDLA